MLKKTLLLLCILCSFSLTAGASAFSAAENFSLQGLQLGDSYEQMLGKFGKPKYNQDRLVHGTMVTYYFYPDDIRVGLDTVNKKVVAIEIHNKNFQTENGVSLGATPYKLQQVYGKNKKEFVEGKAYFVYVKREHPEQRLLLEVDAMEGYLTGFELTSLSEDNSADGVDPGDDGDSATVESLYIRSKEIDMSALQRST